MRYPTTLPITFLLTSCATISNDPARRWLAGNHHNHSQFSVGWEETTPPKLIISGDAIYPIPKNAEMAKQFGLEWCFQYGNLQLLNHATTGASPAT